jgi:monoamine oxidase
VAAVAVGQAIRELDAMAAMVPLETPWTAVDALAWDSQTVETWLQARVSSERARAWLREAIRGTLAAEARDLSLLHALFVIRSAGGIAPLLTTGGGAQERRFHQGAQTISIRLAESLGERVVLGAPAQVVRHGEGGVVVEAGGRAVAAGRAILAVPPAIAGRIGYRPALPGWRNQLTQRVPMGSVIKVHALYDEPFGRTEGLSGFVVSDTGPVRLVYDNSPEAGSPGVLVGFIEGEDARTWARRDRAERRAGILAGLTDYFGERAGRPGSCWSGRGRRRSTAAAASPAPSRPGSGPPSARPCGSPSDGSTGPGPRPPPSGPPSWKVPSSPVSGPPTRCLPPPSPPTGSGRRPGRPGASARTGSSGSAGQGRR